MGATSSLSRSFVIRNDENVVMAEFDLWLTLVALVASVETCGMCCLAMWRHSRNVYNAKFQRWAIRLILIGPVYSIFTWGSLWMPQYDYLVAVPVGFYEGYASFCFLALLCCFSEGEEKLALALGSVPGGAAAFIYHPFGSYLSCGRYTPVLGSRVGYFRWLQFASSRDLLVFLKRCVMQTMVIKPLTVVAMMILAECGYAVAANWIRIGAVASLWLEANALTQLFHVTLPRIRSMGGELIFVLLLVMIVVLVVQDVVIAVLLMSSGSVSATEHIDTRLICILTIITITVFATMFYRLLPPSAFARVNWSISNRNLLAPGKGVTTAKVMPICTFIGMIFDVRTMFAVQLTKEEATWGATMDPVKGGVTSLSREEDTLADYDYGFAEHKDTLDDGASETTRLVI